MGSFFNTSRLFTYHWLRRHSPRGRGRRARDLPARSRRHFVSQPSPASPASPASPGCSVDGPPGPAWAIGHNKPMAVRSTEHTSRGLGGRCCPWGRSGGVFQQAQGLQRQRNRQEFQGPRQTAAELASVLVKRVSPARPRNGMMTGDGEPVRHQLAGNNESTLTRFRLLEKPAP